MISLCRRVASSTIARPALRARDEALDHVARRRARPIARGLVELLVRRLLLLGQLGVERRLERHDTTLQRDDRGAALGGEAAGEVDRLLGRAARRDRHEDVAVLERDRRPDDRPARAPSRVSGAREHAPPVDDVEAKPGDEPAEPGVARRRVLRRRRRARRCACRAPPKIAKSGQSTPRMRRFGRTRNASVAARLATQLDHRDVRDREREHRAERVHACRGSRSCRATARGSRSSPAKTTSESHGVLNFGCSRRKTSGSCR